MELTNKAWNILQDTTEALCERIAPEAWAAARMLHPRFQSLASFLTDLQERVWLVVEEFVNTHGRIGCDYYHRGMFLIGVESFPNGTDLSFEVTVSVIAGMDTCNIPQEEN